MRGFGPPQAHPLTSGMRSARWPHDLSGSREDLAVEPGEPDAAAGRLLLGPCRPHERLCRIPGRYGRKRSPQNIHASEHVYDVDTGLVTTTTTTTIDARARK